VWSLCAICAQAQPPPKNGGGPGGGDTGGDTGSPGGSTSCTSIPCAAALLNDVGTTTASGTDARSSKTFAVGENIYGPFEAGFGASQDFILEGLGCSNPSLGYVAGGIDTHTAEQMVAQACSITLPRVENDEYISLIDECGGHTSEYHFHERLSCLYEESGGHSTQVGEGLDGQYIYGKWEDYSATELPKLDACGGHFGVTPDSAGVRTYHYHVQESAPFTIGCFGPSTDGSGGFKLVTVAECRSLYDECGNGDTITVNLPTGSVQYDPWCPCYDATGSSIGTEEHAVFASSETTCSDATCTTSTGSTGDAPDDSTTDTPDDSTTDTPDDSTTGTGDSTSAATSTGIVHGFSMAAIATSLAYAMAPPLL